MSKKNIEKYLLDLYKIGFPIISEEEIRKIPNLSHTKTVYEDWPSNDYGDSVELYISEGNGNATRYFLRHHNRDWFGGWSFNDTFTWVELSKKDYSALYSFK